MGGHGGQSAQLLAKIIIACITNRRVYFDILLLMKDLSSGSFWFQRRKKVKSCSLRGYIDL